MIIEPKRKPHEDDRDRSRREHQEEQLDEALKNTFPASDPISIEQPLKQTFSEARQLPAHVQRPPGRDGAWQ